MSKTIAFHLQKGGVGKTTIAGTLACQSALEGNRTLLVDIDPQGNASSWFFSDSLPWELADVLEGACYPEDAIVHVPQVNNLFLLPTFGIGGTLKQYSETKLIDEPYVLQDLVAILAKEFDRILLDLSPGLGRLERCALIASDEIITPLTPETFSLDGLQIFIEELKKIRKSMRSNVKHESIIINAYDERIRQHQGIYQAAMAGTFRVFKIPVDPVFRKSQEAKSAPQLFRKRGKGLKQTTIEALAQIDSQIWR